MRTVLIIYPHWPPSNLVGVHRIRLVANHLKEQGWHPIVLTVHESHYEHDPVPELNQLVDSSVEVIKTSARPVRHLFGNRLIGDLGVRAFGALRDAAQTLLSTRTIDFIWFSVPSWYPPLMGPRLFRKFGVPYGIDYQDPWIHPLPEGTSRFSRARLTQRLAQLLEPQVLKDCQLITAINPAYIDGIAARHPELDGVPRCTFQLGFDEQDHTVDIGASPPWPSDAQTLLYAGAYLPLSEPFHRALFRALRKGVNKGTVPNKICLVYIGTGRPDLPLTAIAQEENVEPHVLEMPDRISFLSIQSLLKQTHGILIVGSPEPHYSASKVFQCILANRPLLALLHDESEALDILRQCNAGHCSAGYTPGADGEFEADVLAALETLFQDRMPWTVDTTPLAPYHARRAAESLSMAMNRILDAR